MEGEPYENDVDASTTDVNVSIGDVATAKAYKNARQMVRGTLPEDEMRGGCTADWSMTVIEEERSTWTGCDAALIGLDRFDDEVLSALPELRVVALCSAGADHLDPAALKKHNVRMGWVAGINKHAVSEMAISTMINIMRNFHNQSERLHRGEWPARRGGRLLQGKTVGIHGCGNIGQEVVNGYNPLM